ncbi:MAG TPA: hypothetical protein VJS44_09415 [Pyrinomonadaceae bacterium]|nr:hypothetical protein [Pyrinomonadaceae bacterium]
MRNEKKDLFHFRTLHSVLLLALLLALSVGGAAESLQNVYPEPPADKALIYLSGAGNALSALPFEQASTPLRVQEVARSDKRSYLELQGEHSSTVINQSSPRFYLFVRDAQGVRPPFIVRLAEKKKSRRVEALSQKGFSGFAVPSEEIIRPRLLVLKREDGMLFMEVSPRYPLAPGEYAFVGADPSRIATFRIVAE